MSKVRHAVVVNIHVETLNDSEYPDGFIQRELAPLAERLSHHPAVREVKVYRAMREILSFAPAATSQLVAFLRQRGFDQLVEAVKDGGLLAAEVRRLMEIRRSE